MIRIVPFAYGLVLLFAMTPAFAQNSAVVPDPMQYLANSDFHSRPARPILDTKFARLFRTKILAGAKNGPNFAGHYTLVTWGCGMDSYMFVIVDAVNGKVHIPPVGCITLVEGNDVPIPGFPKRANPGFRLDSKLLLTIGVEDSDHADPNQRAVIIYLFDKNKFKELYRAPAPLPDE